MTQKELEQYRALPGEIEQIEKRIRNLEKGIVHESVKGSSIHFPYTEHRIHIQGINAKEISRLKVKLMRRKYRLITQLNEIEAFIDSIEDSLIRQAITLYYIEGKSWQATAVKMGYSSESIPRMMVNRYFEKLCALCEKSIV